MTDRTLAQEPVQRCSLFEKGFRGLGKKEAEEGKAQPVDEVFREVRKALKESHK